MSFVEKSTITYTKNETVRIELSEGDVKQALKVYLSGRLDIPDNANFDFDAGSDIFRGVTVSWTETPELITEEID